jgi:hypothetical protein
LSFALEALWLRIPNPFAKSNCTWPSVFPISAASRLF